MKKTKNKVFGPISNLEEHVQPDWWKRIFNSIYLKTDGDMVNDNNITSYEVNTFLNILNPENKDISILDICCGQGRHILEMGRRGYKNLSGLDRSHYLIQKAKQQANKENLNITFKEGDARKLPYPTDSFDIITILGNSFGYFDSLYDDLKILKEIYRILKPYGKLLIDVADGEFLKNNFDMHSWEWIDKNHFVCRERSLSTDKQRLISREIITNISKGVLVDQFYAERLYNKESLAELFKKANFPDAEFHSSLDIQTERNQDLGMMAKRYITTTIAKKEWTNKRKITQLNKNIAIIMGDPNKSDPIKLNNRFNDEDFYTINQLKNALGSLKEYTFTYLNNHDTLLKDLTKLKKIDYVFNLCDEGFYNDPTKELHIPTFLELLNIPYTGSGPQSLAHCYDKSLIRGIAKEMNILVPDALFVTPHFSTFNLSFNFPAIIKPNMGDSSFGILAKNVVNNADEMLEMISSLRQTYGYDLPILIEEFLTGKDLTFGVIGNPPDSYTMFPIIEEDYSSLPSELPKICGYEAKWVKDSPYWNNLKSIRAELSEDVEKTITNCSINLFTRLNCKDYCRFDWRLDSNGNPKLLEINPNPGWCFDGHLAKMCQLMGVTYPQMLKMILNSAEGRFK